MTPIEIINWRLHFLIFGIGFLAILLIVVIGSCVWLNRRMKDLEEQNQNYWRWFKLYEFNFEERIRNLERKRP